MTPLYTALLLVLSIGAIIWLSTQLKFNIFFVLLIVATAVGFAAGLDGVSVLNSLKTGFGSTLEKIGLLIIFGTTLGVLLAKSGATMSLAQYILTKTGEKRAPLAIVLIGFLIGLPIFCDSGFVVLSGLVLSMSTRMPERHAVLVVCLSSALFSVHCLVPPHPGITAAAGILKVDFGRAIILGAVMAIPSALAGYFWAHYAKKFPLSYRVSDTAQIAISAPLPSPALALLPILIPIFLIALKSFFIVFKINIGYLNTLINVVGEPIAALFIGILMTYPLIKNIKRSEVNGLLDAAIDKSGSILALTAAGGAFGEIIKTLDLGKTFGDVFTASGLGLLIPFALSVIFKTAQGSSTVAVISTAGIVAPLLPPLGLATEGGQLLTLAAAGAGSMGFSHTNDSYFWVVSKFGQLDTNATLKTHSTATAIMAVVSFISIWLSSFFIK